MTHAFLSDTEYGRVEDDWVVGHRNRECSGRMRRRGGGCVCGVFDWGYFYFWGEGRRVEGSWHVRGSEENPRRGRGVYLVVSCVTALLQDVGLCLDVDAGRGEMR